MSFAAFVLHTLCSPYTSLTLDRLQAVSLLVICITQFSGIIIAARLDDGEESTQQVVAVLVTILNILVLVLLPLQLVIRIPAALKACMHRRTHTYTRACAASTRTYAYARARTRTLMHVHACSQTLKKGKREGQQLLDKMAVLSRQVSAKNASQQLSMVDDEWKSQLQSAGTVAGPFIVDWVPANTQLHACTCGFTNSGSTHNHAFTRTEYCKYAYGCIHC